MKRRQPWFAARIVAAYPLNPFSTRPIHPADGGTGVGRTWGAARIPTKTSMTATSEESMKTATAIRGCGSRGRAPGHPRFRSIADRVQRSDTRFRGIRCDRWPTEAGGGSKARALRAPSEPGGHGAVPYAIRSAVGHRRAAIAPLTQFPASPRRPRRRRAGRCGKDSGRCGFGDGRRSSRADPRR